MKRLLTLIFVLSISAGTARAEEEGLRPLSEILGEEQSQVMITYSAQRCAALFAVVAERTGRNPSATQDIIDPWKVSSDFLTQISTLLLMDERSITAEEATNIALKTIFEMSKLYDKEMEDYYLRTGNSFNEKMQGDILTCTEVHNLLKEGLNE